MSKIQFGSEVYTWFMQGTGRGYDNKLDHMIKVASEAGITGIEPMVLEIYDAALGCSKYWLGDFCDSSMKEHLEPYSGFALVCAGHEETEEQRPCADGYPPEFAALRFLRGAKFGCRKFQDEGDRIGSPSVDAFQCSEDGPELPMCPPDPFGDPWLQSSANDLRSPPRNEWMRPRPQRGESEGHQTLPDEWPGITSYFENRVGVGSQGNGRPSTKDGGYDTEWHVHCASLMDSPPPLRPAQGARPQQSNRHASCVGHRWAVLDSLVELNG